MSQPTPTCLRCKNWLPRETPPWAARLGMAICAKKLTKAVTLNHWRSCTEFTQAEDASVGRRIDWLGRCRVKVSSEVVA